MLRMALPVCRKLIIVCRVTCGSSAYTLSAWSAADCAGTAATTQVTDYGCDVAGSSSTYSKCASGALTTAVSFAAAAAVTVVSMLLLVS
jgi:hypothetical protein